VNFIDIKNIESPEPLKVINDIDTLKTAIYSKLTICYCFFGSSTWFGLTRVSVIVCPMQWMTLEIR